MSLVAFVFVILSHCITIVHVILWDGVVASFFGHFSGTVAGVGWKCIHGYNGRERLVYVNLVIWHRGFVHLGPVVVVKAPWAY